ncbi:hypothetical protein B0T16DRAFT_511487 [Cercophora newfieldiana]|uniref:Uncharacterized protein n=1 Tax=Cercophora newfieldiana TaxID=92897 RepID=A0AA39Y8G1_9PEZI|nr:hypothetical protein B0T16DRAFT_511487 [Cercophora newfieldiana]
MDAPKKPGPTQPEGDDRRSPPSDVPLPETPPTSKGDGSHKAVADSRILVEMMSFLDPDGIPEDMFIGGIEGPTASGWQYWDAHRFNEALVILQERRAVDRVITASGPKLRIPRVSQLRTLHLLHQDPKHRNFVFRDVVAMTRRAFPVPDIVKRDNRDNLPRYKKYISQVIATHAAFVKSRPKLEADFNFLTILRDAALFCVDDGYNMDGAPLAETGMVIGMVLVEKDYESVFFVLLDCISSLGNFSEWLGIEGRRRSYRLMSDAFSMLEKHLRLGESLRPLDNWTQLEKMQYGRAWHERGVKAIHFDWMEEADEALGKALYYYRLVGDQHSVKAQIANVISFQGLIEATRGPGNRAVALINDSLGRMEAALGTDSPWYVQAKNSEAMIAFTIGDLQQAATLYEDLSEVRIRTDGRSGHDTLSCQYMMAVCYHNLGDLVIAEGILREVINNSRIDLQWRAEDLARAKFRLSLVLGALNRRQEAVDLRNEALTAHKEWEIPLSALPGVDRKYTDKEYMKLFDDGVVLYHGRTTGIWSAVLW